MVRFKTVKLHLAVGLALALSVIAGCGNDDGVKPDTSVKSAPAEVADLAVSVPTTSSPVDAKGGSEKDKKLHGDVPIGAVIDWWRPDPSFPIPDGYEICDGSVVQDPKSPLDGHTLPDLSDRFVMGITNPDLIGETGGSSSHRHQVDIDHQHDAGHTDYEGRHNHLWLRTTLLSGGDLQYISYGSDGLTTLVGVLQDGEGVDRDDGPAATWFFGKYSNVYYTENAGNHRHDFNVPALGSQLKDCTMDSNVPPFYGLLKIMRVR
jgi:hypothetical protein